MTLRVPVVGSGERQVGRHELLFSTTDRRGIIRSGNSSFARISGHRAEQLVGAAHNLVRHPEMPAGVFRLLWDRLLGGRPVAAYLTNRAKDGAAYRVFATLTPLGPDFLSVRVAPMGALAGPIRRIYAQALEVERDLTRQGLPRPAVAAAGAREIERRLVDLGFADYDEFMLTALPDEVAARGALPVADFVRPQATGALAAILGAAARLDHQLGALVGRLRPHQDLTAQLGPATDAVVRDALGLQHAVEAARTASMSVADTSPVLLNVANVMGPPMTSAVQALERLAPDLRSLHRQVGNLAFRVALARVHTEMVAAFAAEVVDGVAPRRSLTDVPRLCDAVSGDVGAMSDAVEEVNDSLAALAGRIGEAADLIKEFRIFLGQWRILVLRRRQGTALAGHLGPIDAQLDATSDQLAYLDSLAARCRSAVAPFDRTLLDPQLRRIRAGVEYAPAAASGARFAAISHGRRPTPSSHRRVANPSAGVFRPGAVTPAHALARAASNGPAPIWPEARRA